MASHVGVSNHCYKKIHYIKSFKCHILAKSEDDTLERENELLLGLTRDGHYVLKDLRFIKAHFFRHFVNIKMLYYIQILQ